VLCSELFTPCDEANEVRDRGGARMTGKLGIGPRIGFGSSKVEGSHMQKLSNLTLNGDDDDEEEDAVVSIVSLSVYCYRDNKPELIIHHYSLW